MDVSKRSSRSFPRSDLDSPVETPELPFERAQVHAALGDPLRLAIVDALMVSDRSPDDLAARFGLTSNLLAHHLGVLEVAGLLRRAVSRRDRRRRYLSLVTSRLEGLVAAPELDSAPMLFVCTHNSARSQLAAALWRHRTGGDAESAGTEPAERVHPGTVAAALRHRLPLVASAPRSLGEIPAGTQVVTVCDRAREDLVANPDWWHWSLPDPVEDATTAAFDAVVAELDERITRVIARNRVDAPPAPSPSRSPNRSLS